MHNINWSKLLFRSYVPYSGIKQACIIIGKTGTYYPGVRVENISFPLTIEAVQAAVFACLSEGDSPDALLLPETGTPPATPESVNKNSAAELSDQQKFVACGTAPVSFWCEQFGMSCETLASNHSFERNRFFRTDETRNSVYRLDELTCRCIIPHSSFPVAALLITDAGIFSGVNIEVSDWQKGLCAERTAIAKALASGAREFHDIHVYAPKSDYVSPCGACRQVLLEHMSNGTMLLHHNEFELSRLKVSELLPYQLKAQHLSRINSK